MEFYKLYGKLMRHTNCIGMMRRIDRICRPEYYERQRQRANQAMAKLMRPFAIMNAAMEMTMGGNMFPEYHPPRLLPPGKEEKDYV